MKKITYTVTHNYCSNLLGFATKFDTYKSAREFALKAKKDADNTNILIIQVITSGIFKKSVTTKVMNVFNEF